MTPTQEIIAVNQRLLDSIAAADWQTYEQLCHPRLTCFEPETRGNLVGGMAFHKYYFDLGAAKDPRQTTMASPVITFCGNDVAIIAYLRLTQKLAADGNPTTAVMEETRIWHRENGHWRHVHFQRSAPS
ncbi:MAG: nuclear transport factor 2 family protein [Pirellulales bacterium]|nr:nuclear transport factor 2 family protein [Pirellulales bacterium]